MRTLLALYTLPGATPTIEFGGMVAAALGSELTLLTVLSESEAREAGERLLEQAAAMLPDLNPKRRVRHGAPADEILAEIDEGGYDLVVVGAHDRPTVSEMLLGTVARPVIAQAKCSVLVVRHPNGDLNEMLICTAAQEASDPTVAAGAKLAQAVGAKVTLLHVTAAVPSMYAGLSRIEETLPELLQTDTSIARHLKQEATLLNAMDIKAELELRHGVPAEEILRAVELQDFDLLVVGGAQRGALNRLLFDDVALEIVDHSPRPVLVVRGPLGE